MGSEVVPRAETPDFADAIERCARTIEDTDLADIANGQRTRVGNTPAAVLSRTVHASALGRGRDSLPLSPSHQWHVQRVIPHRTPLELMDGQVTPRNTGR